MERFLQSQSVNVDEKHQQEEQQQQPIEENEEFGGKIHQDERSHDKDDETEDDGDVDEPALKKPKLPLRNEGYALKRALQKTFANAGSSSADTTADLPAMIAAAAAKTPDKLVQVAIDFLEKIAIEFPNCVPKSQGAAPPLSCSCLSIFRRTHHYATATAAPNQVTLNTARYMVYFQQLRLKEQYPLFIKWILAARQRAQQLPAEQRVGRKGRLQHVVYTLPSFDTDGGSGTTTIDKQDATTTNNNINGNRNGSQFFICQAALMRILDKGAKFWDTCRNAADAGIAMPVHGLVKSNPINNGQIKLGKSGVDYNDVKAYLEGVLEFATGTGETMVSPHDGETHEILELDADVTKRQLYIEYAFERGWIVTRHSDRTWTTKEREADQDDWNPAHKRAILSDSAFNAFWCKFFPYLRVASHHGKSHNNQEPSPTNRHNRPCQGLSGANYGHVILASSLEALIATIQANGILPRTFPLAPSLEERFENYGMVEVRTEEENNSKEEQGMTTTNNNENKEHYVIRSKSCDGIGNVHGICKSCTQVSRSVENLSMRLALQSSTPAGSSDSTAMWV